MNMNDPFGRLQRRDEAGYASLKESLDQAGVSNAGDVHKILARMRRNVWTFAGIVLVSALLLLGLFPDLAPIVLALALFFLVLAFNSLIQGRRGMKRYIAEELQADSTTPPSQES